MGRSAHDSRASWLSPLLAGRNRKAPMRRSLGISRRRDPEASRCAAQTSAHTALADDGGVLRTSASVVTDPAEQEGDHYDRKQNDQQQIHVFTSLRGTGPFRCRHLTAPPMSTGLRSSGMAARTSPKMCRARSRSSCSGRYRPRRRFRLGLGSPCARRTPPDRSSTVSRRRDADAFMTEPPPWVSQEPGP